MSGWLAKINAWDTALFKFINLELASSLGDAVMPVVSDFVYYLPLCALVLIWLAFFQGAKGRYVILGLAILILLTDWTTSQVLRPWLARPRPYAALEGIRVLDNGWHLTDAAWVRQAAGSFGLPSAHAANTLGLAAFFSLLYPRIGLTIGLLALVIGLSRVYLGVHYPLDVVAGFGWGGLCGLALSLLIKRLVINKYSFVKPKK